MKKLSDYKGEDAIELWADLLDPVIDIIGDPEINKMLKAKQPMLVTAKAMVKNYAKQVVQIIERVDPTPVDGFNLLIRLMDLLNEVGNDPTIMSFFESAAETGAETPSGFAMASTEGEET